MKVRALQRVAIDPDTIKEIGEEFDLAPQAAKDLIALGQVVECKSTPMIVVPDVELYLPEPSIEPAE